MVGRRSHEPRVAGDAAVSFVERGFPFVRLRYFRTAQMEQFVFFAMARFPTDGVHATITRFCQSLSRSFGMCGG